MDSLPLPAFEDYFRVLSSTFPDTATTTVLPIETSRGCWWGERSHCTFCGLNGEGMKFRRKRWHRVVEEVDSLMARHPCRLAQFTDNILALDYFKDLIPYWADRVDSTKKFFEVKSNLTRDQLGMLKRAGVVSIQPGVESLADDTLRLMRKGVTGAQNVATLRWSAELGIKAYWNLIFGFPNEPMTDYEVNLSLMKLMTHLSPPDACSYIRLDRFSPNFMNWRASGFSVIRPVTIYKHIFPFEDTELMRLAYYFAYEHEGFGTVLELGEPLKDFFDRWHEKCQSGESGSLVVRPRLGGGFVLVDTRFTFEPSKLVLSLIELELLLQCDSPVSPRRAVAIAATVCGTGIDETQEVFDFLVSRGVVAVIGKQAITLALLTEEARQKRQAEARENQPERGEEEWQLVNMS